MQYGEKNIRFRSTVLLTSQLEKIQPFFSTFITPPPALRFLTGFLISTKMFDAFEECIEESEVIETRH